MFGKYNSAVKLGAPTVVLGILLAVIGWVAWSSLNEVADGYSRVSDVSLPKTQITDKMFSSYREIRISIRTLGLSGLQKEAGEAAIKNALVEVAQVDKGIEEYKKLGLQPGEEKLFERVLDGWADFKAIGERILKIYRGNDVDKMAQLTEIFFVDCPNTARVFTAAIDDLAKFHNKNAAEWSDAARAESKQSQGLILYSIGGGLLLAFILSFWSLRSITILLNKIGSVSENLEKAAVRVSSVSDKVAEVSEVISSGSTQQAAALQQTTSAVEETSSMVQKNADNARLSSEISKSSQATAERGKAAVLEVSRSMDDITTSNAEIMEAIVASNREVANIINVINEIGSKTKVINEIVFQTKLLSFNASVEAARAGEHGKGFAVVAEEVGNLAQMSGKSAREITELLDSSVKQVQDIVDTMKSKVESLINQGVEKVESGKVTAERCAQVLEEIVDQVTQVNAIVTDISQASQEQARGIQEMNNAIVQLDSSAQLNSSAAKDVSISAEDLRGEVHDLDRLIESLNTLVRGSQQAGTRTATIHPMPATTSPGIRNAA